MSQNLISLNLTEADFAEIDAALGTLETKLASLIDLHADARRYDYAPTYILRGLKHLHLEFTPVA